MTNREKIVVGIMSAFLILAVIGLTVGLVIVANSARVDSSLRVQYKATNVDCTIYSEAQLYNGDDTKSGDIIYPNPRSVKVEPTLDNNTTTVGTMAYDGEIKIGDSGKGYVVFTITVTNDATDVNSQPIMATGVMDNVSDNLQISIDNAGASSIDAGAEGKIFVTMRVMNNVESAEFVGNLIISVKVAE